MVKIKNNIKKHRLCGWKIGDVLTEGYLNEYHNDYWVSAGGNLWSKQNIQRNNDDRGWLGDRIIESIFYSDSIGEMVMGISDCSVLIKEVGK